MKQGILYIIIASLLVTLFLGSTTAGATSIQAVTENASKPASFFWEEDFSAALPSGTYFITASDGSGLVDNGSFKLTEDVSLEHGRIFLRAPALMNQFIATYRVNLGSKDGTGADGIAFIFCPVYNYSPDVGGTLDATCPGGYMVALDTFEENESFPDYIYIAHDSFANRLNIVESPIDLEDGAWHDVAVYFDQGSITVMLDGNAVISEFAIPGYTPFLGYFGFGAATGMYSNDQRVDDIQVQVPRFWEEDFSTVLPSNSYFISASDGSGLVDNGSFKLTEDVSLEHGRIFLRAHALMNQFIATYRVNLGSKDWTGADGIAFIFCPVYDYPAETGGSFDAICPGGYMVALDTMEYYDSYPDFIHIAHDSYANILHSVQAPINLEDGAWHDVAVYFDQGIITVMLDGNAVISGFAIPGYVPFQGYFGFSAATGMYSNEQRVDDLQIQLDIQKIFMPVVTR